MSTIRSLILLAFAICFAASVQAQGTITTSNSTSHRNSNPVYGRDLWFTLPQNYDDQSGKDLRLYVTSPVNTTVHVAMSGVISDMNLTANTVSQFKLPLTWEMKTSAKVENSGVHVWSEDADITASVMSHNPYTSDGFYVIPPLGWGTEYVVASYQSLYEAGTASFDYPSEFAVVANHNHTVVMIDPVQDIRGATTSVVHPKNVWFADTLNAGQSIQYKLVPSQNSTDYDMTGTVVRSTFPVGVIGASMCPNIPADYPYCDFICEMIPPVRTWAKTYYTGAFAARKTGAGDTYLAIGSKAGQTIYRTDAVGGKQVYAVLANKYDHLFQPNISAASKWESDAPFMLVSYINSSTYPDEVNGTGDPAMSLVNSVEQFTNSVIFNSPTATGSTAPYTGYANLIVPETSVSNTTFDGKSISSFPKQTIDGIYAIYRAENIKPGQHTVVSDTGVGVYIYGYGYDESYAWTGNLGAFDPYSGDTIAPVASFNPDKGNPLAFTISIGDQGKGITDVRFDSLNNVSITRDTAQVQGTPSAAVTIGGQVIDYTRSASVTVVAYDEAGNQSRTHFTYQAPTNLPHPGATLSSNDFGTVEAGSELSLAAVTIHDTSSYAISFDSVWTNLPEVFRLDPSKSPLPLQLAPGESKNIYFVFHPDTGVNYKTTVYFRSPLVGVVSTTLSGRGEDLTNGVMNELASLSLDPVSQHQLEAWFQNGEGSLTSLAPSPNPVDRLVTITVGARSTSTLNFELYSVLGEKIFQSDLGTMSTGVHQFALDLSKVAAGNYIYRLSNGSDSHSGKLTVERK